MESPEKKEVNDGEKGEWDKKKKKIFNLEVVIKKEWRRNVKKNKMENCNT